MNDILQSMFYSLSRGNPVYLPSKFWEALNSKNVQQLESGGLDNIKQTVAQNYFTWVIGRENRQFRYLIRHTKLWAWPAILKNIFAHDPSFPLKPVQQRELTVFTRMLWKFTERFDSEHLLSRIHEPLEGNPFKIYLQGKLISQDLANSVLEYYSICKHFKASATSDKTICELGAGYGRNAYVFLKALPKCKYIIIDFTRACISLSTTSHPSFGTEIYSPLGPLIVRTMWKETSIMPISVFFCHTRQKCFRLKKLICLSIFRLFMR